MLNNDNDLTSAMIVTLTVADLRSIVREAVRDATGAADANTSPLHGREFLSASQLAQRIGVGTRTVKTMVSRDGLPAHTVGPRLQRFLWAEVEQWLLARGKNLDAITARAEQRHLRRVRG